MRGTHGQTRNGFIFYALLSAALFCSVAAPVTRAETFPFKSYTTSDGLAHDRVNRIVRDTRGFLWFCTSEGLSRFDGYEFKNYTQDDGLPHRAVFDFLETRGGELWLATGDGLVLFNPLGKSNREKTDAPGAPMFRVWRSENIPVKPQAWSTHDLIEDRAGTVWVAASDGVYRLEKTDDWRLLRFDIPPAKENKNEDFWRLLEDRRGAIWTATEFGLYRILPDRSAVQTINKNMRAGSLLEDRAGRVWVGSVGGGEGEVGLHLFSIGEDEPRKIRTFRRADGLVSDIWLNDLLETADGRIYVVLGEGLCEFAPPADPAQPPFRVLSRESGVTLGEDAGGNVWFSTNSGGVRRLARGGFVNFEKSDNLQDKRIASIVSGSDGETYVLAEQKKIHRFDGEKFVVVAPREMIVPSWGRGQISFLDSTGAWWVSGAYGLQRYPPVKRLEDLENVEPQKIYTTRDGLWTDQIFRLFEDSRGDIWISSIGILPDTLTRWERATETIHRYTMADGLPWQNAPTAFGEDRAGNIWIGYYAGGLVRYRAGKFESFTAEDGLPAGYIGNIFTDSEGRVWVATSAGGALRVDNPTTDEKPRLMNVTTRDGLSSNQANCTTEDTAGRIYIATGRGVNRLDLQTGRVKVFTTADGLPENIVTQCKRDVQGALWFGTWNGLARYVPQSDEQSQSPPVFFSDLRVNGESFKKLSELGETTVENLEFNSEQRQVQIAFFALGFGAGERLLYQYKLDGTGADWSEPVEQRTINLNLSPGNYRLLVRAVNAEGVASDNPASVSFSIARPVWQRWWFLLIAALAVSALVYAVYRYRVNQIIKLERVRTRIATDLHDDIGSSLSKIAILSEVVRQKNGKEKNGGFEPLEIIANTSREMVDSMSDIVWAINPERDHLSDLVQRMRHFAEEILDAQDIEYQFSVAENLKDITLGADLRREIYLIFKECVNNLAKHSRATEAEFEIRLEKEHLIIGIEDNGHGFAVAELRAETSSAYSADIGADAARSFGGNGLRNMKRRAQNLGGDFVIDSQIGNGTRITLKIPVGKNHPLPRHDFRS
jgi:signal transduction histidine kinase/ligand-binding sensor domain-containing protein